jgi:hypothetical protein
MGNAKEALRIITDVLDDIYQAIDFCKEHDDRDLWEDLIKFALDKPSKDISYPFMPYNYTDCVALSSIV